MPFLSRSLGVSEVTPTDDEQQAEMDHFINSTAAHGIALFFATVAFVLSIHLIYRHLQYYTRPLLQRQVVRIILIIPVYAVCSALSLTFDHHAHYINTIRDCYEAYCIHCFLVLMLDFPGGEAAVVEGIKEKGMLHHPTPFCYCPVIPLGADFIRNMKRTTLQFVVLKPLLAIFSLICLFAGVFNSDAVQYILLVVYNLSYTTALYGLFLFYLGTKKLLKGFSPVGKFSAVKIIVFATYYQSLLVVMIPGMDDLGGSEKWNDWIICFEMALFAVMHEYCFSYKEFMPGGVGIRDLRTQGFDEPMNIRIDTSWTAVKARLSDVFNFSDTYEDLMRLFNRNSTDHVMLGIDGGIVADGTAQHVMDKMADAASTGLSKMSKLTHVRVVEEGDLNTDKEGLFASAPGSKMLVKLSEGVEKIKSTLAGGREGKEGKGGAGGGAADDIYGSITIEGAPPPTHSVAGSAHASTVKTEAELDMRGRAAGHGGGALSDLMQDFETGNLSHGLAARAVSERRAEVVVDDTGAPSAPHSGGESVGGIGGGEGGAGGYILPPPPLAPAANLAEKAKVEVKADPMAASAAAAAELLRRLKAEGKGGAAKGKRGASAAAATATPVAAAAAAASPASKSGVAAPINWEEDKPPPGDFDAAWDEAPTPSSNPPPTTTTTTINPPTSQTQEGEDEFGAAASTEDWPEGGFGDEGGGAVTAAMSVAVDGGADAGSDTAGSGSSAEAAAAADSTAAAADAGLEKEAEGGATEVEAAAPPEATSTATSGDGAIKNEEGGEKDLPPDVDAPSAPATTSNASPTVEGGDAWDTIPAEASPSTTSSSKGEFDF